MTPAPKSLTLRRITDSQRELLRFVSLGYQNKEIASRLGVTEAAVKKRVSSLMRRYVVPNRAALVRAAMYDGQLDRNPC